MNFTSYYFFKPSSVSCADSFPKGEAKGGYYIAIYN